MSNIDYNFASRLLHQMALQSTAVAEISFDIENTIVNKDKINLSDNHVFITGLARSGTTILMRYLYETGLFRSLTYKDMPFVLMPNIWKKIRNKKTSNIYKERAHQDKIMVGFDSPEALEEIFWRVFSSKHYIANDRLRLYEVEEDVLKKFQNYIANILLSADSNKQTRYLSKNNNNVLRILQLQKTMPGAQFIVPFRDPLQHALSLLNQHILFSEIQKNDKFSLEYMNWLGHFEFGLNQKPFFFNDEFSITEMSNYKKTDLNFWLINWRNYYSYITSVLLKNTTFFNYDEFCEQPDIVMPLLFDKLNISAPQAKFEPFTPSIKKNVDFDKNLLEECNLIYKKLTNYYQQWFNRDIMQKND